METREKGESKLAEVVIDGEEDMLGIWEWVGMVGLRNKHRSCNLL